MDKYLQYNYSELSEDPSFIRWAKGSPPSDDHDWNKWIADHPEMKEKTDKARALVLAMKFKSDKPESGVEDKIWSKISSSIKEDLQQTEAKVIKRRALVRFLPYAAVAAIALLLLYFNIGGQFDTNVSVPMAQVKTVTLPDGSTANINADSKLQYDIKSWDQNRLVSLEGEAFFSVEKGSKFSVQTNKGTVEVLGTSFNVYSRKGLFEVQCETGKVSVKSAGQETILMPEQSVSVVKGNHSFNEKIEDSEKRSTWQKGIFVYEAAPIRDVVDELERQFDVKIQMDKSVANESYTGSFNKSNFENALTEVFYPLGLKYEVNGQNVSVTR